MFILAITQGWYHYLLNRQQAADRAGTKVLGQETFGPVRVGLDCLRPMEETMHKSLAVIAGTVALLSGALLTSDLALAGGSASAPSKYAHANRVMSQQANQQAGRTNYPITEYSSSSMRSR